MFFLLTLKRNLYKEAFSVLKQKPIQILPQNLSEKATVHFLSI